jgi:putative ABC transport system ATP-binding protein
LSGEKKKQKTKGNATTGSEGKQIEGRLVYKLIGVTKSWSGEHGFELTVPELMIRRGEKVALVGFSGCGKSTLLDLLAMILQPDTAEEFSFVSDEENRIDVAEAWRQKNLDGLAQSRMRHIGYVLQTGGLLPFLPIHENIGLSRSGLGLREHEDVRAVAEKLGIQRHLQKYPSQLSVGERQRVAIGRAMAHDPSVVIADEPTASLDPITAEEVMGLFTQLAAEKKVTLIVATHEWERVEELGFRRVAFNLKQDTPTGTVRARVSG